ncbi:unnamed protein product [Urochloa humidicola]
MAPLEALSTAVILLVASALVVVGGSADDEGPSPSSSIYQLELIHVDANGGFTKDELIHRAERRSRARAAALSDDDSIVAAAADNDGAYMDGEAVYSQGEYLMKLGIGTPEKPFMAIVDTGSDVIWTKQVERCTPSASSSFANNECPDDRYCNECAEGGGRCMFSKTYGSSKMEAKGFMAKEKLTLLCRTGRKEVRITFGCAEECRDDKGDSDCPRLIPDFSDGIVGLSKSPKSLLSQLDATRFSYCLSSRLNKPELTSPIWFGGDKLSLDAAAGVQTTPLVSTRAEPPSVWAYRYYVELDGISVGGDEPLVGIPGEAFEHRSKDGGKGVMFVDSGCSFSKLETAAYNVLKNLVAEKLAAEPFPNKYGYTCFKHTSGGEQPEPDVVLHFTGAKMRLPWSSYTVKPEDEPEHSCLTILDSGKKMSILGNFQQQNIQMLYDLRGGKLQFVPVPDCSKRNVRTQN